MPYPNEHSCRIKNPDAFQEESFRRIERGEGENKLTIIIGRPEGETTTTTQAYRYDKETWSEARALSHCEEEGGTFEPAEIEAREGIMINLDELDTLGKLYASHNRLHAEYVDARHGTRRKGAMQEDHTAVVGKIKELGGRHIPHGEVLDDTLPDELKEAVKLRYMSNNLLLEEIEGAQVSKIQVLRTGTFYHPAYGKFTITQDTLDSMVQNFSAARPIAPTEMVVDWEHMSVAEPPVIAKAAGWVRSVFSEDGKLFAAVEWTADAVEQIQNKQYRFISPEIDLNYRDKESNEKIGPTLLSVALTNRPFIEGMEPVVLSEELASMVFSEELAEAELAEWTTADINDLPDSSFAYIAPGGEKDENGKTVPRSLRHLPFKDKDGDVDLPHLRDALAQFDQTNLSLTAKVEARRMLISAAQVAGVGEYIEKNLTEGAGTMTLEELRTLFGLGEKDDVAALVTLFNAKADEDAGKLSELQTEVVAATERATIAEGKVGAADAEKAVSKALTERKITPKMRAWALKEALRDPDGFSAFVAVAEVVGPVLEIKGKETTDEGTTKLTETELRVGKLLGVSEEAMIKAKEKAETQANE